MRYHKACNDCVMNHQCLLQDHNDVEECEDVRDFELNESKNKESKNDKPTR